MTAVASVQVSLQKTLLTGPANLDMPESYRLRIAVSGNTGSLNLTAVGPVVDTLPPGTVFNGATPAADCQPGCVGTTPATVTWTSPCSLPVTAGEQLRHPGERHLPERDLPQRHQRHQQLHRRPARRWASRRRTSASGTVTHPVTTFVPNAGRRLPKDIAGGSPNPPTLNQTFSYDLVPSNSGNVPLDNLVVIDTLPVADAGSPASPPAPTTASPTSRRAWACG